MPESFKGADYRFSVAAAQGRGRVVSKIMILITGFRPFSGRGVNGSETVARSLGGSVIGGAPVVSEILDVIWGAPERDLPDWIESYVPNLLLGLGEGAGDQLRFESRAVNFASGIDEAGNTPASGSDLRPGGAEFLSSTMRFDPAWVADLVPSTRSDDAGVFLCNAWLYSAVECASCPTTFVHLPVQGVTPEREYLDRWVPPIREILSRNLPA